MGRLFEHPLYVLVLLIIILLLFGAPKLPGMARSLGQSMRIFKSEVSEMKDDDKKKNASGQPTTVVNGEVVDAPGDQGSHAAPGPAAETAAPRPAQGGTAGGNATGTSGTGNPGPAQER